MTSLADTLWHEFAVETEDHLLTVEPLLARGDPEQIDASEISELFRSFHSIKGIARAMDVLGMEAVAHHAENLLGLVRDAKVALNPALADMLLQAVDALKQMRGRVAADHADAPADPALLSRLAAAYAELGGSEAPSSAEPSAPETTDGGGPSLHEDPEMLGIFVEMLKLRGAELCEAMSPRAEDREIAADTAETLAHAAEVMAFDALSETLTGVFDVLHAAGPDGASDGARQELVSRLAEIGLQIELLSEITGEDAGAAEFAAALAARTGDAQTRLLTELGNAIEQVRADFDSEDWVAAEASAAPIARLARDLRAALAARSLVRLPQLLLLVDDLYSRAALGEVALSDAMIDATGELLGRIDLAPEAAPEDCSEDEAAALTARLRGALPDRVGDDAEGGRMIAGVHVPVELALVLSGDNLAGLEQGLADGLIPYAILMFLEREPVVAERLVDWLRGEARPVANRTVVTGSESSFEFLVLAALPPADLAAALLALDPAKQCVRQVRRLTEDPLGQPVLDPADAKPLPDAEPARAATRRATTPANVIRVRSEAIDTFLDEIGEMRTAVGALSHVARAGKGLAALARSHQLAARLPAKLRGEFAAVLQTLAERERLLLDAEQRISGILGRVHQSALELRVVPVDLIFNRLPRVVRDLAVRQGKSVELSLEGRDVRIDKSMVEALADPLLHMVRNAVDHGIETAEERRASSKPERARVTLKASQRGAEVDIEIADDGRGLDADAIRAKAVDRGLVTAAQARTLGNAEVFQFIFAAGLSTAAAVTETSGRGVGMDVVLTTVRRLNGDIGIRSEPGKGTAFTLTLPVSAALQNALIVRVADQSLAIPERYVSAVIEIADDEVRRIGAGRSIVYRQAVVPLHDLGALLGMTDGVPPHRGTRPTIVASSGRNLVGLEVAAIERRQELFLKDLHPLLAQFPGVGGASVLDDGRVVLVLDGDELMQLAARGVETEEAGGEKRRAVT